MLNIYVQLAKHRLKIVLRDEVWDSNIVIIVSKYTSIYCLLNCDI